MILAASILAADFSRLADEIARAERGGAAVVHVDVMDGHFVPKDRKSTRLNSSHS